MNDDRDYVRLRLHFHSARDSIKNGMSFTALKMRYNPSIIWLGLLSSLHLTEESQCHKTMSLHYLIAVRLVSNLICLAIIINTLYPSEIRFNIKIYRSKVQSALHNYKTHIHRCTMGLWKIGHSNQFKMCMQLLLAHERSLHERTP